MLVFLLQAILISQKSKDNSMKWPDIPFNCRIFILVRLRSVRGSGASLENGPKEQGRQPERD